MFAAGISILLIPFSFDFVDSLCIAAVLGFLCRTGDALVSLRHQSRRRLSSTVAVSDERDTAQELLGDGSLLAMGEATAAANARAEPFLTSPARPSFSRALLYLHSVNSSGRQQTGTQRSGGTMSRRCSASRSAVEESAPPGSGGGMHWGIALAAAFELVLSAISDKVRDEE